MTDYKTKSDRRDKAISSAEEAVQALEMDALKRANAELRADLATTRETLAKLQVTHQHLTEAHYKLSTELSAMSNPEKREQREADLLIQLGATKSQLFEEQARNRELNHQCEQLRSISPAEKAEMKERGDRMLATLEATQRALGVPYDERHARSLPAHTQDMLAQREEELVGKTQTQLDRERYQMLIGQVRSTRAVTVGGLKTKLVGMLSDLIDDLATGDDDE